MTNMCKLCHLPNYTAYMPEVDKTFCSAAPPQKKRKRKKKKKKKQKQKQNKTKQKTNKQT